MKNLKLAVLFSVAMMATNAMAQVYIPPAPNQINQGIGSSSDNSQISTIVETDKMTYAPGDTVNVVVYYQNTGNEMLDRAPQHDMYRNQMLRLHSDPELSGGGTYLGDITALPVKQNWSIEGNSKRPYLAYSFKLTDARTRRTLPRGYYVIAPMPLAFKGFNTNSVHRAKEGTKVIFIGDTSVTCTGNVGIK